MRKDCVVVIAPACAGKTHLANLNPRVLDLGPMEFTAIEECPEKDLAETQKDIIHTNPKWPLNYFNAIKACCQSGKYDIVCGAFLIELVEDPEFARLLEQSKLQFRIAIPNLTAADAIVQRMHKRGNNPNFISRVKNALPAIIAEFGKDKYNAIIINDDEFLEHALKRVGLLK